MLIEVMSQYQTQINILHNCTYIYQPPLPKKREKKNTCMNKTNFIFFILYLYIFFYIYTCLGGRVGKTWASLGGKVGLEY